MERVDFKFKNGHVRIMGQRQAELLGRLGHGTYQTRMLVADQLPVHATATATHEHQNAPEVSAESVVDLDAMEKEQLHALAKERGVKVHHLAGADKVRAALRGEAP